MTQISAYAVSLVVPIYNAGTFLPRCLHSIRQQSLQNIQIICVDDGSTDNSAKLLSEAAAADKRFTIITQENRGLSEARNRGLEEVKGKYVFFLDADDYLHPQALEIFYNVAEKSQAPVVISDCFLRLGKDKQKKQTYDSSNVSYKLCCHPLEDLYSHRFVSAVVWNKLYRTDTLQNLKFIKGIYFEDWPFTACLFAALDKFALIHEKLYVYNTTSPSIVRSDFSVKKIQDYITGIHYVHRYLMQQNKQNEWQIIRKKRITTSMKMILSKISKSQNNKDELEKYFLQEYAKLKQENLVYFSELSLKSQLRLLRIMWHQR
ncbi:MAG: glycosyltransferase family 2 protein [Alphaproteobacteria bacterium]|nr:glycosyltransferase family 2 protein [Alphaproteobacteria bacterium]